MLGQLHSIVLKPFLLVGVCLALTIMTGCSSSQPIQTEEKPIREQPEEKRITLSESEATFNPSEYDREIELAPPTRTEEQKPQTPIEIPKDSMALQEEVVQGYRIQIFSSPNMDEATAAKNLAVEKCVGDSIYVVFDAPVYKVRIGDFVNRYEANLRLPEFIEKGFRDPWVVPDRIVQRKLVPVPSKK